MDEKPYNRTDKFTWKPGDLEKVEQKYTFYEIKNGKKREIATMLDTDKVVTGEKAEFVKEKLKNRNPQEMSIHDCFADYTNIMITVNKTGKTVRLG